MSVHLISFREITELHEAMKSLEFLKGKRQRRQERNEDENVYAYQFGIPPTNTSELVANFPKWNSFPLDVRICDTPSTVSVVCSSFLCTWKRKKKNAKLKPQFALELYEVEKNK